MKKKSLSLRKEIIKELGKEKVPVEIIPAIGTGKKKIVLKTKKDMKEFEEKINNHMVSNCFFKPLQKRIDDIVKKEGNGKADWVDALNRVKKEILK